MRLIARLLAGALLSFGVLAAERVESEEENGWTQADRETLRLPPSFFPQLPPQVTQYLKKRKCTVPQPFGVESPSNVVRGEFQKRGQTDWVVLCSRDKESVILLFWGGSTAAVGEIGRSPDRVWLQGIGGGIGFSRFLSAVGKKSIVAYYQAFGGPAVPEIDHEGIDDAFVEKGSTVHYWHDGAWLDLTGAD